MAVVAGTRTARVVERDEHLSSLAGQACPQDGLATWDQLPFGYVACHHFDT